MSVIPCEQNADLRRKIERYVEELKTEAHRIGTHGLDEHEFYNSGLFRGAIERVRGQFSATMRDKTTADNIVVACASCNHNRGTLGADEFVLSRYLARRIQWRAAP